MYQAQLYSAEYGDLINCIPCASFDDGVLALLEHVEGEEVASLTVESEGEDFVVIVVGAGDLVLGRLEDVPVASGSGDTPRGRDVIAACNALAEGDSKALKALFMDVAAVV